MVLEYLWDLIMFDINLGHFQWQFTHVILPCSLCLSLSVCLQGLVTIRAFRQEQQFLQRNRRLIDESNRCFIAEPALNRLTCLNWVQRQSLVSPFSQLPCLCLQLHMQRNSSACCLFLPGHLTEAQGLSSCSLGSLCSSTPANCCRTAFCPPSSAYYAL